MPTWDQDSQKLFDERATKGAKLIEQTWGRPVEDEERESAAKDAVSDILTSLFGAAGSYFDPGPGKPWALRPNELALNDARAFIERAFESWVGDAEDYAEADDG